MTACTNQAKNGNDLSESSGMRLVVCPQKGRLGYLARKRL